MFKSLDPESYIIIKLLRMDFIISRPDISMLIYDQGGVELSICQTSTQSE